MTLADLRAAAQLEPAEVHASRRRAIVRRMQRLPSIQRERDLLDLGWRPADDAPLQPLIGYRDLGGESG